MFKYIIPILLCFNCYASDFSCENVNDKMFEHELLSTYSPESITSISVESAWNDSNRVITDRSLKIMAAYCPNLEELEVFGKSHFTDEGIETLAERCPKLKRVFLAGDSEIGDLGVISLAEHCPMLEMLLLDGSKITDEALIALGNKSSKLEWLLLPAKMGKAGKITDAGIKALAEGCPELDWIGLPGHAEITDQSLFALAENCPNLTSLRLTGDKITDEGLVALANGCEELCYLSIPTTDGYKGRVTDKGLRALSEKCFELATLNLKGHTKITDQGVLTLVENSPYLKEFIAAGHGKENKGQLTDRSLIALSNYSASITVVDVSQNPKITFAGAKALIQKSSTLSELAIEETSITKKEYSKLCKIKPDVEITWSK